MDSTIEVTQRLDRLSIAANAPSRPAEILNEVSVSNEPSPGITNQPTVSSETSTRTPAPRQSQVQTATPGITTNTQDSDNDVTMSDDIITATRNLSIRSNPLQNPCTIKSHRRQHAEWSRLCNMNQRRHGTLSIAMINIRARQASQARPRPRPRPSRQAREEAPRFFRQCAQIENRQTSRASRRPQIPVNTPERSTSEAGMTREEHHRNLVRAQLRYRQQIRLVSAIAASAGH